VFSLKFPGIAGTIQNAVILLAQDLVGHSEIRNQVGEKPLPN
jgi:hypothetical protein